MNSPERIRWIVFALSAVVYFPFSEWISTTEIGTWVLVVLQFLYFLPLMAVMIAAPVLIFCLFFRRMRQQSKFYLLLSAVYILCCTVGILLGDQVRMAGMGSFSKRSEVLVDAIKKYENDHSSPPEALIDLVPDYLPFVPSTGMMAYPEYRYDIGDDIKKQHAGNAWILSVNTSSGILNFDMMVYFPNRSYPVVGFGGQLEPVGEWAYVHE